MARLIINDGTSERALNLNDPVTTFGRAPENKVMIADRECSRRHFQIERTEQGHKLVDLESRNGTKVNDRVVNQHLLAQGDRIQIGATSLTFQGDAAPEPAAVVAPPPPPPLASPEAEVRRRGGSATTVEKIRVLQRPRSAAGAQGSSSAVKVVAVGAGLLFGAVALLILVTALTRETPGQKEARNLIAQAEAIRSTDPKGAAELLRRIPSSEKESYDRARQLLKEIEATSTARRETPEDKEEADLFDTLYELQRSLNVAYARILERCSEYEAKYPQGRHAADVAKIRTAAAARAAEVENQRGAEITRSVDDRVRGKRYAEALRIVNDALQNKQLAKHYAEFKDRKNTILTEGKDYYNRQIDAGEDLVKNGKNPEARALFLDLQRTLGGSVDFAAQLQAVEKWLQSLSP